MTASCSHHIVCDGRPPLSRGPRYGPDPRSWPVGGDRDRCSRPRRPPATNVTVGSDAAAGIQGWFPVTSGCGMRRDNRTASGHTEIRRKKRQPLDAPSRDESRG